jgi:CO/xanthine dehydrogenase FAD-binding subunit
MKELMGTVHDGVTWKSVVSWVISRWEDETQMLKYYHRPDTVETALQMLAQPSTAVLGGGTHLIANLPRDVEAVVDLQAVGLTQVLYAADSITLGAMVRLQTIVDEEEAPRLLRQMAHREGPNTFRRAASVGGVLVGADPDSELLATFLVLEAEVTVQTLEGTRNLMLPDFLADVTGSLAGGLVTAVSLRNSGRTAHASVSRTPKDKPIVAAIARLDVAGTLHLALCGVAATPISVDPHHLDDLAPPDDFLGSSSYRRQMAKTLSQRVLSELLSEG